MTKNHPSPPLTPSAFLEAMAARVSALQDDAAFAAVRLRGVPMKPTSPGPAYGGFRYATIKDPRTPESLSARVPEAMFHTLEWGREAVLVGTIRFKASKGELKPEFRLDGVEEVGEGRILGKDELRARWQQVIARPKRDVDAVFGRDRPNVCLLTGPTSVAPSDIRDHLRDAEEELDFEVAAVSMWQPEEVAKMVRERSDADLLIIARGGGSDVHVLDADVLIEAVASSVAPVIVALGHADDALVLDRVADRAFANPSACGAWMRKRIEQRWVEKRRGDEAEAVGSSEALLRQLEMLQKKVDRWQFVAAIGILFAIVLAGWLFWKG